MLAKLLVGEGAAICLGCMIDAQSDHAFGAVVLLDPPRRVEVMPTQIWPPAAGDGTAKTHFLPKRFEHSCRRRSRKHRSMIPARDETSKVSLFCAVSAFSCAFR